MDFQIIDPPVASIARWRHMHRIAAGESILRSLQYETLDGLNLTGSILDFGGGQNAFYKRWLTGAEVKSVNIDAEFSPTHVVPPGERLPFVDGEFDAVLTMNTLEHVYDDIGALRELARVTRDGGQLHVMVPFIFRVHGHPDDYHRHTPSWWGETLGRIGYRKVEVTPQVFGRRTTAQLIGGPGGRIVRPLTGSIACSIDILYANLFFPGKPTYSGKRGAKMWAISPGWYIRAEK